MKKGVVVMESLPNSIKIIYERIAEMSDSEIDSEYGIVDCVTAEGEPYSYVEVVDSDSATMYKIPVMRAPNLKKYL